jgi:hypothetical protein
MLGRTFSTDRTAADLESIAESISPLETIRRSNSIAFPPKHAPKRGSTTSTSSSITESGIPTSAQIFDDVISEKLARELLRNGTAGLENLKNPNVRVSGAKATETLLHWLIKRCKDKEIRYLIYRKGIDINAVDSSNLTPLYHAVNLLSPNKVDVVKAMIKRGANFGGMKPPKLTGIDAKKISDILSKVK